MIYEQIKAKFTPVNQETEPEKWSMLRTTGIGGSDAGAIMGLNKYASKLTVYMAKCGAEGFSGNETTEWGHILEDPIRNKAAEELGVTIEKVPGMFTSDDCEYLNANLDGLVDTNGKEVEIGGNKVTGIGGYEIKTSTDGTGFSDEEIPDSYYAQVQHYMNVCNLSWFILTVFILSTKQRRHYIVERNDAWIEDMVNAEKDFWENNVLKGVYPDAAGIESEKEYIEKLPMSESIELTKEIEDLIFNEREIDNQIKTLKQKQEQLKNQILIEMFKNSKNGGAADKVTASGTMYKVTYNTQMRKSVDSDLLKKDGLYEKYSKESSSKVMRISEIKK